MHTFDDDDDDDGDSFRSVLSDGKCLFSGVVRGLADCFDFD